tara:strand:- start:340 stop:786 length:447 start_codon:yes stop_codon:yes gene_type:complete
MSFRAQKSNKTILHMQSGFSLIELLIVLTILGLLMAIATPALLQQLGSAKVKTARIEMKHIAGSLDIFFVDIGRYPTQKEGMRVLIEGNQTFQQNWAGPYLSGKEDALLDPWGNFYQYKFPGQHGQYDLYSFGPNGVDADEEAYVTNW